MRLFLPLLLWVIMPITSYTQCPDDATNGTNGSKDCIQLTWDGSPPDPLPATIDFGGVTYTLETSGNPAAYKASGSNCSGTLPGDPITGNLSFGTESCDYVNGVLPVVYAKLIVKKGDGAEIEWTTLSEVNNEYFAIERSSNGKIFHEIGVVPGFGTINARQEYFFNDPIPLEGISYYRLAQYDYDGSSQHSDLLKFKNYNGAKMLRYEAKTNIIYVSNEKQTLKYQIINLNGQIISSGMLQENEHMISTESIPPGMYFVTILNQEIQTIKIMIAGK